VLYVNKQEFSASSWRSNQGYTKMHGQPTIKGKQMFEVLFGTLSGLHCLQAGSLLSWLSFPPAAVSQALAKSIIFEFKVISFIFF